MAVTTAKVCGSGGVRVVIAENLLLKQQLIVLRRARQRAPNLTLQDRLLCGVGSLFLPAGRLRKVAIGIRPATLLAFHQALVRLKYRRLFSSSPRPKTPGAKGPSEALIPAPRGTGPSWLSFIGHTTVPPLRGAPDRDDTARMSRPCWNARDLERKLADFQTYYDAARSHASLAGHTPVTFASGRRTVAHADLNHVRWVSRCRDLVQLPVAA